ncbi:MAG: type II toxin-antitoxin system RelE/ParE family toxin [Chitinophagaceae bacterium]|nr:type II toxin-antitoxin system RelE/ParE family toxin [Chitinophagaceae bacterium]MCW5904725.1 type II toxin-antitoxin system RelE/ParE family toxin [Chitinophagaceae bacterium]
MAKVILRQEAINDLTDIWNYTMQEWSENQANKYYEVIKSACNEIGKNPSIGRNYVEISKYLLGLKSGKHIIFYHPISENEVEIIRILHERMDLKNRLNK